MRCQNCGRELKNGARFCIACGAQHDSNGQLVGTPNNNANNNNNQGNIDYNKTMMVGNTGFKQYSGESYNQNNNQADYSNGYYQENLNNVTMPEKKKISPILIICPIIIVLALIISLFTGKTKKNEKNVKANIETTTAKVEETKTETETAKSEKVVATVSVATVSEVNNKIHLDGYWSADAEYFYIDGEMQKNMWIGDYYVGDDGKKVVNNWVDTKYYVDATGKKVRNEWIEFSFIGENGQKKIGFYYVDKDGLKVTNKTIDGRYLNEVGCYWPDGEEDINDKKEKNIEKSKTDESEKKDKKEQNETKKAVEQTQNSQTTAATTMVRQNVTTQPPISPPETFAQNVAQNQANVRAVASDGKSVAYQIVTTAFPNEKITKYDSIVINDANYPNLAVAINEWNNNQSHNGINPGETILNNNISITYDIQVERNDNKVFSFYVLMTKYDNNIAYDKERTGYTWDVATGQILDIKSIFNGDEKLREFATKVISKIKSSKKSIDEDTYEEIIQEEPEEVLSDCTWYMTNTGVTVFYNRNKIGNDGINGLSFNLTYSESGNSVNKLLLTKYRK